MKFFIATKNAHKIIEFERVLAPLGIELVSEADLPSPLDEVDETGTTFEENAYQKAEAACRQLCMPCVADDSGICVDALGGAPGVFSARYAGEHGNNALNNQKLLSEMADVPDSQRGAHFACAICCCFPDGRVLKTQGRCYGRIAHAERGQNGFGYDPLFIYGDGDITTAEMSDAQKDEISHRGKALRDFAAQIKSYI